MTGLLAAVGLARTGPPAPRRRTPPRRRPPGLAARIGLAITRRAPAVMPAHTWTVRAGDVRPGDIIHRAGVVVAIKASKARVRLCVEAGEVVRRHDDAVTLQIPF